MLCIKKIKDNELIINIILLMFFSLKQKKIFLIVLLQ